MKGIAWNDQEIENIKLRGEVCEAVARAAMERSGLNFDDIEQINNHYESHAWGSNTDRKYRKAAINRAVKTVASNPAQYSAPTWNTIIA